MTALESFQPYVAQLFEDDEVSDQLSRAAANLRRARARAGHAKTKRKVIADPELRYRLARGVRAAWAAGVAVQQAPEKQRRKRRRTRLALVALVGGVAAWLAFDDSSRGRIAGLLTSEQAS